MREIGIEAWILSVNQQFHYHWSNGRIQLTVMVYCYARDRMSGNKHENLYSLSDNIESVYCSWWAKCLHLIGIWNEIFSRQHCKRMKKKNMLWNIRFVESILLHLQKIYIHNYWILLQWPWQWAIHTFFSYSFQRFHLTING